MWALYSVKQRTKSVHYTNELFYWSDILIIENISVVVIIISLSL